MITHQSSALPTIRQFDGRFYTLPDEIARKLMNSGVAGTYIKYAFCLRSNPPQPGDPWQYDDFWHEWINTEEINAGPFGTA